MSKSVVNSQKKSFEQWFSEKYLYVILILLTIFILLPIIAPVLMKIGYRYPAKIIYWAYGNLCHQLPYRSWFLFGKQFFYPLQTNDNNSVIDFYSAFNYSGDLESIRNIIGDENLGYKMAICQRDLAMYSGLLLTGFVFLLTKRKVQKISLWIWLFLGVLPLGIDGITQLAGAISWMPSFIQLRESTPLLRTITGGLFGIFTGWYIFPAIEDSIKNN